MDVQGRLVDLFAFADGTVAIEDVGDDRTARWRPMLGAAPSPWLRRRSTAGWTRAGDAPPTPVSPDSCTTTWWQDPGVGSEPELEVEERQDEPAVPSAAVAAAPADLLEEVLRTVPSPLADFPAGAAFGTLVHTVLEHLDPAADDLTAELARALHGGRRAPVWDAGGSRSTRRRPAAAARDSAGTSY